MPMIKTVLHDGVASFSIKVQGNEIPATVQVISLQVSARVNSVATASIVLLDGDMASGQFELSASSIFLPGNSIRIEAGYNGDHQLLFEGIITGQTIRIDGAKGSLLELACSDTAVKMTVGSKCRSFAQMKDSDIMASITAGYSGVTANIAATVMQWPSQVQYNCTDWDFLQLMAAGNGMLVTALNGMLSVFCATANTAPVVQLTYGADIIAIELQLDALTQLSNVKATAWDHKSQSMLTGSAGNGFAGAGNLSPKTLSAVVGLPEFDLPATAAPEAAYLDDLSKATMLASELAKITGTVVCQGTSIPGPGKFIRLDGVGARFNGDHFVSGVVHTIAAGNWTTEMALGLAVAAMAPAKQAAMQQVNGLLNGIVKKIAADPESQYRILVEITGLESNGEGIWARLSNFYASNGAGAFFLPEIGDEVVLGFLNSDARYPLILGSVYSSTHHQPFKGLVPEDENLLKAIVSRSGIALQFDDENKVLTLLTPAGNSVVMNEQDKAVSLQDQNGNSIVMNAGGISMKSSKDIHIEAAQSLALKAQQGVTVESSGGDITLKGINIKETAGVAYTLEGGQSANISSAAQLSLKSGLIMIN
ncbi:Rhs element Vgr protein [Ostertagia ostertagi]